uniref:Uncharacterized protein n=1 Tax=Strigamia maritima TaxID=126957 RepID=T1J3L5_STRMM
MVTIVTINRALRCSKISGLRGFGFIPKPNQVLKSESRDGNSEPERAFNHDFEAKRKTESRDFFCVGTYTLFIISCAKLPLVINLYRIEKLTTIPPLCILLGLRNHDENKQM